VSLLDKLMTRVGELVLARNQILQRTKGSADAVFLSTAQRLNLITTELQESVMKTRMQPIGNVWTKFPRVVRDLSAQLGKQVRIEMEGKETELDKTIVEAIKDPLTHIIRNSVDHGIERPEVRTGNGKPAEGLLLLRAYHEGGQVNIEINDDGAGLNSDRIRKKAVERGLITADAAARMSDREAAQLIVLPGFSTAEQVTSVSGRGVGMDVVKTNIERIGGTIDLQSTPGQGMTVRIKIPLTLAIIPALVVTCGGDRYAIPQVNVLELVRLEKEQSQSGIEMVHGAPVFRLRGKLLPLVDLARRLNLSESELSPGDRIVNIVVLRANDRQFGLVVDGISDTEEIVVKPLSPQLKGLKEYAGATIMGDGAVALIIDVMGIALASGLVEELHEQSVATIHGEDAKVRAATETLLVVDLGDARRFALPISMISRLETAPSSAIEHAGGQEVIQYRGAILPLVRLTDVLGGPPRSQEADEQVKFIVYADEDYTCGLIVHRIVDIVETELQFDRPGKNEHLLGTVVIQKHVTDVLNLRRLARPRVAAKTAPQRRQRKCAV
jgi:two-component system chemotaxis sensor kinase CheA